MADLLQITFTALAIVFMGCLWTAAMLYHAIKATLDDYADKKRRTFDGVMALIYLVFPIWFVVR